MGLSVLLRLQVKDSEQNKEKLKFGAENYSRDPANDYLHQ